MALEGSKPHLSAMASRNVTNAIEDAVQSTSAQPSGRGVKRMNDGEKKKKKEERFSEEKEPRNEEEENPV